MSWLWLLVANGTVSLTANEILRRVRTGAASTDAVLFCLLRLVLISAAVMAAGLAGQLRASVLGGCSAAVLAALVAAGALRRLGRPKLPSFGGPMAALAAVVGLRLAVQVWFFSPAAGDALEYHLPKVGAWIVSGTLTADPGADLRGWFPAGFELIEAWWVVFLHHDVLIEMAGLEFLALAAVSAYALARQLGGDSRTALLAAALFGLTPGLYLQALCCLNDGPVAAVTVAFAALTLGGAPMSMLAMTACLGIGIKPTFAFLLPGLGLLALLDRRRRKDVAPDTAAAVGFALLALAVGAFWYGRNYARFRDPFYPMGTDAVRPAQQQFGPRLSSLAENAGNFLNARIYDRDRAPSASYNYVANWGAVAFALGVPALLVALRTDRRLRRLGGCYLVSAATAFLMAAPDPWSMRFVLFLSVLPAIAAAAAVRGCRPLGPLLVAAVVVELVSTCVPDELDSPARAVLVSHSWRDRSVLPSPPSAPPGSTVGWVADLAGPVYLLYGPGFERRVVLPREDTAGGLREALRGAGAGIFYVGRLEPARRRAIDEGVRRGFWSPFGDAFGEGYRLEAR